jgi:hypothetical protein
MANQPLGTSTVRKRLFLPVPWKRADLLRLRLQRQGIPAIACYEPADHTAGLEILSEVDLETVRGILDTP